MKSLEINTSIVSCYIGLLSNLSTDNKLELISQLSSLVKTDLKNKQSLFKQSFGALETEETAEEMIKEIRASRISTRKIEQF